MDDSKIKSIHQRKKCCCGFSISTPSLLPLPLLTLYPFSSSLSPSAVGLLCSSESPASFVCHVSSRPGVSVFFFPWTRPRQTLHSLSTLWRTIWRTRISGAMMGMIGRGSVWILKIWTGTTPLSENCLVTREPITCHERSPFFFVIFCKILRYDLFGFWEKK